MYQDTLAVLAYWSVNYNIIIHRLLKVICKQCLEFETVIWSFLAWGYQNTKIKEHAVHSVGWPTTSFHLDIPKYENGQCQKWKVDHSI